MSVKLRELEAQRELLTVRLTQAEGNAKAVEEIQHRLREVNEFIRVLKERL